MSDAVERAAKVMAPVFWRDMQPDFVPSAPNDYDALTEEAQETVLHYTTMLAQALADAGLLATEWQVAECDEEVYEGHCHDETHSDLEMEKLKSVRTEVRKGIYEYRDLRPLRLVGPWVWPK